MSTIASSRSDRVSASGPTPARSTSASQSCTSLSCIAPTSAMLRSAISDERAPEVNRVPSHSGQGWLATARSMNATMFFCLGARSPSHTRLIRTDNPS